MADIVYLQCFEEGNKVRVKIISNGYNKNANCQFPRDIRVPGRKFMVPASAIKVASGRAGTFFYRVSKNAIKIVDSIPPLTVYESEDCCVCMDSVCEMVMVDCGHLCMCTSCSDKYTSNTCPMCRAQIKSRIRKDQLQ
jgi:Zinc finger, C3HC4 type (RING finger)